MFWMVKIGQRDATLALAKEVLAKADPELRCVYPYLVLEALRYEAENGVNAKEAEAFEARPDVVRLRGQALRDLVDADPANWAALNQLARFQVEQGRMAEARATFAQIGTHWVRHVWDKAAFERARTKAT
jgi:Tetratricopeptide repeat